MPIPTLPDASFAYVEAESVTHSPALVGTDGDTFMDVGVYRRAREATRSDSTPGEVGQGEASRISDASLKILVLGDRGYVKLAKIGENPQTVSLSRAALSELGHTGAFEPADFEGPEILVKIEPGLYKDALSFPELPNGRRVPQGVPAARVFVRDEEGNYPAARNWLEWSWAEFDRLPAIEKVRRLEICRRLGVMTTPEVLFLANDRYVGKQRYEKTVVKGRRGEGCAPTVLMAGLDGQSLETPFQFKRYCRAHGLDVLFEKVRDRAGLPLDIGDEETEAPVALMRLSGDIDVFVDSGSLPGREDGRRIPLLVPDDRIFLQGMVRGRPTGTMALLSSPRAPRGSDSVHLAALTHGGFKGAEEKVAVVKIKAWGSRGSLPLRTSEEVAAAQRKILRLMELKEQGKLPGFNSEPATRFGSSISSAEHMTAFTELTPPSPADIEMSSPNDPGGRPSSSEGKGTKRKAPSSPDEERPAKHSRIDASVSRDDRARMPESR